MAEKFTGTLADFGAADLASAGGKGANLGELLRLGLPVPAGFVVTTAAYAALMAETGLGAELERLLKAGEAGQAGDAGQAAGLGVHVTRRRGAGHPAAQRATHEPLGLPGDR